MRLEDFMVDFKDDETLIRVFNTLMRHKDLLPEKFIIMDDPFILDLNKLEISKLINVNDGDQVLTSKILKNVILDSVENMYINNRQYEKAIEIQQLKKLVL